MANGVGGAGGQTAITLVMGIGCDIEIVYFRITPVVAHAMATVSSLSHVGSGAVLVATGLTGVGGLSARCLVVWVPRTELESVVVVSVMELA